MQLVPSGFPYWSILIRSEESTKHKLTWGQLEENMTDHRIDPMETWSVSVVSESEAGSVCLSFSLFEMRRKTKRCPVALRVSACQTHTHFSLIHSSCSTCEDRRAVMISSSLLMIFTDLTPPRLFGYLGTQKSCRSRGSPGPLLSICVT